MSASSMHLSSPRKRLSVITSTTLGHDVSLAMEASPQPPHITTINYKHHAANLDEQQPPAPPPPSPIDFSASSLHGWWNVSDHENAERMS
ncbi:MAG: hypothetical protein M1819_002459 [Sarea resinae]|nr:MAG: hypothetical protein M1819_002459 [Sarea resinae]